MSEMVLRLKAQGHLRRELRMVLDAEFDPQVRADDADGESEQSHAHDPELYPKGWMKHWIRPRSGSVLGRLKETHVC